jgi:hypothetical protein
MSNTQNHIELKALKTLDSRVVSTIVFLDDISLGRNKSLHIIVFTATDLLTYLVLTGEDPKPFDTFTEAYAYYKTVT